MPIANVSNQATVSAAQLKLCPHPYISAPTPWVRRERSGTPALPPRPVINWGQKRQTQGRDVSTRIKEETGATYHKLGHLRIKKASLIWSLRLLPHTTGVVEKVIACGFPRLAIRDDEGRDAWAEERSQLELFISGSLRQLIPDDHVLVRVDRVLDLSWLRDEVADRYCLDDGRPGIDPEATVGFMLAGLLSGIVHDRRLMRDAQVNLAIRCSGTVVRTCSFQAEV